MDYIVVLASIAGGLCNYNTKKIKGKKPKGGHINWLVERKRHRQELFYNIGIALVSAKFLIPPVMVSFSLHNSFAPALAFFVGYSGMRLLPAIESKIHNILEKGWK